MAKRLTFYVCLVLSVLALPVVLEAQDFSVTTNNGAITITGYGGYFYAIPSTINGLPVVSIGDNAFEWNLNLWSVSIPSSVTNIGANAFGNCYNLNGITIPDSVTSIGDGALGGTKLSFVTLPAGLSSIGANLFNWCLDLVSVSIPNGVTSINTSAFVYCSSLASITIPNSVTNIGASAFSASGLTTITIPESVTAIGAGAFSGCYHLSSITIPNSVGSIGDGAFGGCSGLTNATIGNGVTSIGDGAFSGCAGMSVITVDTANTNYSSMDGILFNKGGSTLIQCPEGKTGNYTIPDSVTNVGASAFSDCNLSGIAIPDSVAAIGDSAFQGCLDLTNVTVGSGLINMGTGTFFSCSSLVAINVDVLNPAYSSVDGVLFNSDHSTLIQFPGGKMGSYAIPDSVTNIGDYSFYGCLGLINVTIPDSVTSIGDNAFSGSGPFPGFNGCPLISLTIPNSVTSIGTGAFSSCPLIEVVIGDGITNIGAAAFSYCAILSSVYFNGDAPAVDPSAFSGDPPMEFGGAQPTVYYLPGTTGWGTTFGGLPTALWKPQVQTADASFGVQTNGFGFNIAWASGMSVVVEASTNLANPVWSPLSTNTLANGSAYFSDPQWTNYPGRFYRLRWP